MNIVQISGGMRVDKVDKIIRLKIAFCSLHSHLACPAASVPPYLAVSLC